MCLEVKGQLSGVGRMGRFQGSNLSYCAQWQALTSPEGTLHARVVVRSSCLGYLEPEAPRMGSGKGVLMHGVF